jgi:hypothetical protein
MPCSSGSASCSACLALGSTCGWCQSSLTCIEGNRFGPSTPSGCDNWAWYYTYCAGDAADKCPPLATCAQCLTAGRAEPGTDPTSCGWCLDAAGGQRCASGQISGPAVGARCRTPGGWLFAQLDLPAQCPAPLQPTRTRTPSPSGSVGASGSPSALPTPTSGGSSSSSSGGGSGGGDGGGAAAAALQALVTSVALSLTLGLLLACACGVEVGWVLRARLQGARGGGKPRPGSVAFGAADGTLQEGSAPQLLVMQHNPVGPPPAFRS